MNILICGAQGFIGRALSQALESAGHQVIRGVRDAADSNDIAIDYVRDTDPADWAPRLVGVDAVINTVGILTGTPEAFERIHTSTPIALFEACRIAAVDRVIQISALGVEHGNTAYFQTKAAADQALLTLPVAGYVLRPALIYGQDGGSSRFFRTLASLPVLGLPGGGRQALQPMHVDDLCACVRRLLDDTAPLPGIYEVAGDQAVTWRRMLDSYRRQMGFASAIAIPVPDTVMNLASHAMQWFPNTLLTPDTWHMLSRGNTTEHNTASRLLGHTPRNIDTFIPPHQKDTARLQALASWRTPMLRLSLALVWLITAYVSACVYPMRESLNLLASVGLTGWPARGALFGAIALDAGFGLATLVTPGRRLWWCQIGVILTYSLIIAIALPGNLAHPFGPVLKNLPILALLIVLVAEETAP